VLTDCLNSIGKVLYPTWEVILVDNGSTDDSLLILKQYPWVKVVCSPRNLGFAGGNDLGLRYCCGDYVLLLNNDTIVSPGFLEPLCVYLENNPHVGVVQGKMLLPRFGNSLDVCGSFLTALGMPYHYGFQKPDGPKYQHSFPVFSGKGAFLMFRREVVERVGGFLFDEDFFCYYEETDFCHRVWLAGYEVHFVPGPPVYHLMGATAGSPQGSFVLRHYLRNMAFSLLSNLSFSSRLRILPVFFGMLCASMLACGLRLKPAQLAAHWAAISYCVTHWAKIRARRRLVESLRRQPDRAVFDKVLRTPHLEYFIKTLTGQLGTYADENLP
jgi:GT2 family glycosyltransferase